MNIKKELAKVERKQQMRNTVKKAFVIIRNLICQHKDCYFETLNVQLGDCDNSILSEIFGEESSKPQKMKVRIVKCCNCGRELSREYLPEE